MSGNPLFQKMTDENLLKAYDGQRYSYFRSPDRERAIRQEMVRRGIVPPDLQKYLAGQSEDTLREAYKGDLYENDLIALENCIAISSEMKRRGLVLDEITLEKYWRDAPDEKLIRAYKQIDQFDRISQEIICGEIKKRRLEAKAATKVERRTRNVEIVGLSNIPFGLMLSFAWKLVWAATIALIPIAILGVVIIAIIRNL